jgi:hypothetical protein
MEGMTLEERIAELEGENGVLQEQVREVPLLREQIAWLPAQVQDLHARLAKDSHNSSTPPSSDGLARGGTAFGRIRSYLSTLSKQEMKRLAALDRPEGDEQEEVPVVITLQAVDDLAPSPEGCQWTSEHYRRRDAVLAGLGIPAFRKSPDRQ